MEAWEERLLLNGTRHRIYRRYFTAEALAYETVGRFEHPQTRSARMESAVAKMLVSELLHHVI